MRLPLQRGVIAATRPPAPAPAAPGRAGRADRAGCGASAWKMRWQRTHASLGRTCDDLEAGRHVLRALGRILARRRSFAAHSHTRTPRRRPRADAPGLARQVFRQLALVAGAAPRARRCSGPPRARASAASAPISVSCAASLARAANCSRARRSSCALSLSTSSRNCATSASRSATRAAAHRRRDALDSVDTARTVPTVKAVLSGTHPRRFHRRPRACYAASSAASYARASASRCLRAAWTAAPAGGRAVRPAATEAPARASRRTAALHVVPQQLDDVAAPAAKRRRRPRTRLPTSFCAARPGRRSLADRRCRPAARPRVCTARPIVAARPAPPARGAGCRFVCPRLARARARRCRSRSGRGEGRASAAAASLAHGCRTIVAGEHLEHLAPPRIARIGESRASASPPLEQRPVQAVLQRDRRHRRAEVQQRYDRRAWTKRASCFSPLRLGL